MTTYTNAMRRRGILLVLAAAVFWAAGGAVTQFLFHTQHLSPEWLVTIRMLLAGTLILVPTACQNVRELFLIRDPDKQRRHSNDPAISCAQYDSTLQYHPCTHLSDIGTGRRDLICTGRYVPSRNKRRYSLACFVAHSNSVGYFLRRNTCVLHSLSESSSDPLAFANPARLGNDHRRHCNDPARTAVAIRR